MNYVSARRLPTCNYFHLKPLLSSFLTIVQGTPNHPLPKEQRGKSWPQSRTRGKKGWMARLVLPLGPPGWAEVRKTIGIEPEGKVTHPSDLGTVPCSLAVSPGPCPHPSRSLRAASAESPRPLQPAAWETQLRREQHLQGRAARPRTASAPSRRHSSFAAISGTAKNDFIGTSLG